MQMALTEAYDLLSAGQWLVSVRETISNAKSLCELMSTGSDWKKDKGGKKSGHANVSGSV